MKFSKPNFRYLRDGDPARLQSVHADCECGESFRAESGGQAELTRSGAIITCPECGAEESLGFAQANNLPTS